MSVVKYTCNTCGKEKERPDWIPPCYGDLCCDCCKKGGLKPDWSNLDCLDFDHFAKGKELTSDEEKGMYLEEAISIPLNNLGIQHEHNPFNLCYSSFQIKKPDIIIEKLNAIIECKNLNEFQVYHLSKEWLGKHIINRPNTSGYNLKMALFSYKPRQTLIQYLKSKGWRTYGVGFQILNEKQERKATRKLKQQFWWLKKLYNQNQNKSSA